MIMSDLEQFPTGLHSSRRHLVKIGALVATALFASAASLRPAAAGDGHDRHGGCDGDGDDDDGHCCFLKGTLIETIEGARTIEDLAVGDMLPTVFGGARPVRWIARSSFIKSDPSRAWARDLLPVRIARSALGPDVPRADLYVTRSHALFIDGILMQAGSLLNGTTITLDEARERDELSYFHIKLEAHDVIYAEGASCESMLDVDANAANFSGYLQRYGDPVWGETPCVPIMSAGGRSEIRSRLRSAVAPWIDRRQERDILRDRLEERGLALQRPSAHSL
jgi:Hint domain-containing protein